MPKTIVHVNQHVIRRNVKTGENKPCITVKQGKSNRYAHAVLLTGPATVFYTPDKPLSCGARCYVVTEHPVILDPEPATV